MEDFAHCAADFCLLVWLQSACSRCAVADVYTEKHRKMKVRREVFCSNERHEGDGAGKQRVNDGLHQSRSKAVSSVRVGQQWAYAGTTWDSISSAPRRGWGSPRLIFGGGW